MPPDPRTAEPDPADAPLASLDRRTRIQASRALLLNRPPHMQAPGEGPELSTAAFLAGHRCHRRLWWTVHDPEAPALGADLARTTLAWRREQVRALARRRWPAATRIELDAEDPSVALASTAALVRAGAPAIERARFAHAGLLVDIDFLLAGPEGWTLVLVDAATRVREPALLEAAAQTWAARASGVAVTRIELLHLDRAASFDDRRGLLRRVDVGAQVEARLDEVARTLDLQRRALRGSLPEVPVGEHCTGAQPCPFIHRCWPQLAAGHVGELYHAAAEQTAALEAEGYRHLAELPEHAAIGPIQRRQILAARHAALIVEAGLAAALAPLAGPLAFLDFETIMPAVPAWSGCRPYAAVAVQFSAHVLGADGRLRHHAHLAEPGPDPRPALAEALLAALADAPGPILAWHAPFERGCLVDLAAAVPDRAVQLLALGERLVDLLPIVREHVYHPGFAGSFGLKRVIAALLPELAAAPSAQPCEGRAAIADGWTASLTLERLLLDPAELDVGARARVRAQLLRYCGRDTLALVELLALLRRLAQAPSQAPSQTGGTHLIPLGSALADKLLATRGAEP